MRTDEQVVAVLTRLRFAGDIDDFAQREWEKQCDGLINNQRDVVAEWMDMSAARSKRSFRERFGDVGDRLRHAGYGAINIGPRTSSAIQRFQVKLAKCLYFRHVGEVLDGDIYIRHIDSLDQEKSVALNKFVELAPEIVIPRRGLEALTEQFFYRINCNRQFGAVYAVIMFNEQFIFVVFAIRKDSFEALKALNSANGAGLPEEGHFSARLVSETADK